MAKISKAWFCTSCGYESTKWLGQCPSCGDWNTMKEELVTKGASKSSNLSRSKSLTGISTARPLSLDEISMSESQRMKIGIGELERLLGGGIVEGSVILIGGEPGIGKSTLALQIPLKCPKLRTLYVSGEESPKQIKLRAQRLADEEIPFCQILAETRLENIITQAQEVKPELLIIDSIQTIYSEAMESSPGSVSQVKECAAALLRYAKETGVPVIIIGHITKDGTIAGPKVLEHIVDVVLLFEGDNKHSYRILRSVKNRFGSTAELAIFEMRNNGLKEITNPSEILTPMHANNLSGIATASVLDGSRPFLIEVQALVSTAAYGMPQRSSTGYDYKRLNMLLAVLEKRAGFKLSTKDVFLNIAGGLKVIDPACDLSVVSSILSSNFDLEIPRETCFAAEVGLSGEIRPVSQIDRRIIEATRLGYKDIYISAYNLLEKYNRRNTPGLNNHSGKDHINIHEVADIPALCRDLFKTN
ncbi:MAG: DNA repair protein RadA [Bacteroidales bacterium]